MKLLKNPREDNFLMPFEGDKHKGTIILLPYREDTWRNNAKPALKEFKKLVKNVSKYETVYLVIDPSISDKVVKQFRFANVEILRIKYNDSWARDNTLIFVKNENKVRAIDFGFNAWGGNVDGLYPDWTDDNKLGEKLAESLGYDYYSFKDFILEGGSIHTDGNGTFLTTEACLLSKGRNSQYSKEEIEKYLKDYLNAKQVIWLPRGIYNDETNEHVDNVCCFLDPHTIAIASPMDTKDIQYELYLKDMEILKDAKDIEGNPYKIVDIPLPMPMYLTKKESLGINNNDGAKPRLENDRLAGSYVNFYMSKDFIILPQFGVYEDKIAYNKFKELYKDKDIIKLKSKEILLAGGNIHCVTMQIPEGESR